MFRRSLLFGWLLPFVLILPGCGNQTGYRFTVQPTKGEVRFKGKPVPKAIVRFHPTDAKTATIPEGQEGPEVMLTSETDERGEFTMSTYLADDGIPEGDYVVTVSIGLRETEVEDGDGKPAPRGEPAGKIYRDKNTSPLKATVKQGENRFTFDVK